MEFFLGGLAACGAVLVSNVPEVIKTRMQLQGELQRKGFYVKHYKNVFHAGYVIVRTDGILALQSGLSAALVYQMIMNGVRLGAFQTLVNQGYTLKAQEDTMSVVKTMVASATAGCVAGFFASPFCLIKTQLQCESKNKKVSVGFQHRHGGMLKALGRIYLADGIPGLWRGVAAALPRITLGSAAQLTAFAKAKEYMSSLNLECCPQGSLQSDFAASMLSGFAIAVCMTPLDVISTRIYNQGIDKNGQGLLYKGFSDCAIKILKNEGFWGFYKGFGASYLRIGPHTVLTLLYWEYLRKWYASIND